MATAFLAGTSALPRTSLTSYEPAVESQQDWEIVDSKRPSGIPLGAIETLSEAISEQLGYEPGSDIREFVGRVGGGLMVVPLRSLPDALIGGLMMRPNSSEFRIIIPAESSSRQDQLTVAIALGHYFLHHRYFQVEPKAPKPRASRRDVEEEALIFALAFLMPKDDFLRSLRASNEKTDLVAATFGVPIEAAERRRRILQDE